MIPPTAISIGTTSFALCVFSYATYESAQYYAPGLRYRGVWHVRVRYQSGAVRYSIHHTMQRLLENPDVVAALTSK